MKEFKKDKNTKIERKIFDLAMKLQNKIEEGFKAGITTTLVISRKDNCDSIESIKLASFPVSNCTIGD